MENILIQNLLLITPPNDCSLAKEIVINIGLFVLGYDELLNWISRPCVTVMAIIITMVLMIFFLLLVEWHIFSQTNNCNCAEMCDRGELHLSSSTKTNNAFISVLDSWHIFPFTHLFDRRLLEIKLVIWILLFVCSLQKT